MLFLVGLLSLSTACCKPALCVKPTLPIEPHPVMQQVTSDEFGGLDEENTKTMLINLELYKGSLDKCNTTIILYNKSVGEVK